MNTSANVLRRVMAAACVAALAGVAVAGQAAAADKVVIAVPGIPPVFGGLPAYVARDYGIFKKYDLDVEVKPIATGVAATSAVLAGNIDLAFSPSQYMTMTVSNNGAPLRAIWGLDHDDWLLGSTDPAKTNCDSMKGQGVAVDGKGGARWLQLNTILVAKCRLKIDQDVKTVPMSSNVATALAAGQLTFGILHYDDIPVIERKSNRKVTVITTLDQVAPGIHYLMLVGNKDRMAQRKDVFARVVAAMRDAADMIHDPGQLDKVARSAAPMQRTPDEAADAIRHLDSIMFFPRGTAGLDRARVEKAVANQERIGKITRGRAGIQPDRKPATYADIVDLSYWTAAQKLKK